MRQRAPPGASPMHKLCYRIFEVAAPRPQVHAPLGVVAVCGRARQGKSYILNRCAQAHGAPLQRLPSACLHGSSLMRPPCKHHSRLLKQTGDGFVVGPTHRPCTKGLWMWSEPQLRNNADGTKQYMVLLDTEGIDAWDQVRGRACKESLPRSHA